MDKILQYIGISIKSRNIVMGTDTVIMNLQKNNLHLIILSTDSSVSLKDKITKKAFHYSVKVIEKYDGATLSKITNKDVLVLGIIDKGISDAIIQLEENKEE